MAYRITISGTSVECDTAAELRELIESVGGDVSEGVRSAPTDEVAARLSITIEDSDSQVVRLLKLLLNAGDRGVSSEALVKALGLSGPRGLGPIISSLNNELGHRGWSKDDVLRVERSADGRRWYAKSELKNALDAINEGAK